MTDPQQPPSDYLQTSADVQAPASESQQPQTPPFQPIYTLVNNTSTRTTHHPQVHYIFSDDDPDVLTQALSQQHHANLNESASSPAPDQRAILLDLSQGKDGAYNVSWASSLSPSWAVLDAQVTRISPPSSDNGGNGDGIPSPNKKRPDRLMLRIEGVDGGSLASSGELKLPSERSGHGSGSGSGSHSGQKTTEVEDYNKLVAEFENRMTMLKKVVDTGEERRNKLSEPVEAATEESDQADNAAAPTKTEALSRSVDSG
ncbi:hypothetical protein BKA67DRAFT_655404 [Truncatella angustata]|uniref:Uncharacterized protein n=1 Tax=Truncatella angustata TaxID=152316 RepID=A0A9P8URW0_9PEZI|nr:uncharacterized protein BKA67DRAFT_655404 [Truncatella angustata]KAH6657113.1 hypothetical protein BKA67DRAFT_655404 [Truncatella angustata]